MEILLGTGSKRVSRVDIQKLGSVSFYGRSNFAAALSGGTLIALGGVSGSSSALGTYPSQFQRVNLDTGTQGLYSLGSSYTWCAGADDDAGNLFFFDGHTGAYNNLVRKIAVQGGTVTPTSVASLSAPLRHSSIALHANGKIYRINGYNQTTTTKTLNYLDVYDIATNTWKALARPIYDTNGMNGCIYNNKIYLFFGWCDTLKKSLNIVQVYDIATNTWSIQNLFFQRACAWGSGVGYGKYFFYVYPYWLDNGTVPTDKYAIYRFDLDNPMAPHKEFIVTAPQRRRAAVTLIDTVKRRFVIAGGCNWAPGSANYDTLDRVNSIDMYNLDTLLS